jgi:hypothetical protein
MQIPVQEHGREQELVENLWARYAFPELAALKLLLILPIVLARDLGQDK